MTATEIIAILEASRKNRVHLLKLMDFEAEFFPVAGVQIAGSGKLTGHKAQPADEMAEPNHQKQSEESLELDELQAREDQIADLLLTDPLLAEQLIQQGELAEDVNGSIGAGTRL